MSSITSNTQLKERNNTMGFVIKTPKTPTIESEPPVVTETQETDMQADYEQKSARRRGLLSTILTDNGKRNALSPTRPESENRTLG